MTVRYSTLRLLFGSMFLLCTVFGSTALADRNQEINSTRQNAIVRAIELVGPSVAGINVVKLLKEPNPYNLLFRDPIWSSIYPDTYRRVESLGSGLVLSKDGYVVTNAHVVENAAEVIVTLPGGHQYEVDAIFTDALTDIALLKIDAHDLPTVKLGDSDDLYIGEWAIALGNPLGLFDVSKQPTATLGIISGMHMDFGIKDSRVYQDMIQTDASINPGNSGGPLVNADGEVIGLNSFIFTEGHFSEGSIGLGFAIPINRAREIVEELKERGHVDRSFSTGLTVKPMNRYIRDYLGLPFSQGAFVRMVDPESAGDVAGIMPGDVIRSANGKKVSSGRDIFVVIKENFLKAGDSLDLIVWRDGEELNITLKLAD